MVTMVYPPPFWQMGGVGKLHPSLIIQKGTYNALLVVKLHCFNLSNVRWCGTFENITLCCNIVLLQHDVTNM